MEIPTETPRPAVESPLSTARSFAVTPIAALFAAVAALYVGTTGALPLLGKDEPRYVEVAREMWVRGDWVTPTLGGHTWFEKPALLYWMIIASFSAFGVSEWAARLGPALCGVATVALCYWVTRRVERTTDSDVTGLALWSTAAVASSAGLIAFSHGATFDIVLTATVTLALCCFFVAELESTPQKRRWAIAGLWAGAGLSLMAKGLVGLILPGGVIFLYFALRREWRGLLRLQIIWGLPLAIAVSALWYGPVIARHDGAFIDEFFVKHHFARYFTNEYLHKQPVYYYGIVVPLLALPWTAFLVCALREATPAAWRAEDAMARLRVFALAWFMMPVAFFSLSGSKLAGYVLPAMPGAMLLVGISLAAYVRGATGMGRARVSGALLMALGVGVLIYATRSRAVSLPQGIVVAVPLAAAGTVAFMMARRRALCASLIAGAMFIATGLLTSGIIAPPSKRASMRELLRSATARGYGQTPVWQMNTLQRSAEFYAADRLLYDADGEPVVFRVEAKIARALPRNGAALVLVPKAQVSRLTQSPLLRAERLDDNGAIAIVLVRPKNS